MTVLNRTLPCGHTRVLVARGGAVHRRCSICHRVFVGTLVLSEVSEHVGRDVERIEWEEVTRS